MDPILKMAAFAIISVLLLFKLSNGIRLYNYTLYQVTAFSARERAVLYALHMRNDMMSFLNGVTNEAAIPMDVIVDGCCTREFERKMHDNDIEYVKITDTDISKQINKPSTQLDTQNNAQEANITSFLTWEKFNTWIKNQTKKFRTLEEIVIGHTAENRPISVLKISKEERECALFLLGGEDGRDWLTPAMLLNFVTDTLEKSMNFDILLNYYDFYILPLLNPDGYAYSITQDRYWSKNRRIFYPQKICKDAKPSIGVNIDRNWFFNASVSSDRDEECYSAYPGPKPLSEEETHALSEFLDSIALKMMAFINLRGFERIVTLPYGYTNEESANHAIMVELLASVNDKVKVDHNASFYFGTARNYFYNMTGTCADWVKTNLNTPIVYTIYMKTENTLPTVEDIEPLTQQFSTMVKETALLAYSIYGPLFSRQVVDSCSCYLILFSFILLHNLT